MNDQITSKNSILNFVTQENSEQIDISPLSSLTYFNNITGLKNSVSQNSDEFEDSIKTKSKAKKSKSKINKNGYESINSNIIEEDDIN